MLDISQANFYFFYLFIQRHLHTEYSFIKAFCVHLNIFILTLFPILCSFSNEHQINLASRCQLTRRKSQAAVFVFGRSFRPVLHCYFDMLNYNREIGILLKSFQWNLRLWRWRTLTVLTAEQSVRAHCQGVFI